MMTTTRALATGSPTRESPSQGASSSRSIARGSAHRGEQVIKLLLRLSAWLSIVITLGIAISLLVPALEFFAEVSVVEFLFGTRWAPTFADATFGVLPLVTATAWTTLIALAVAVPFGLGAAIYLAEYARPRMRKIIKPVLEILAGIPTVVFGFFAINFVTPTVLQGLLGLNVSTFSVLAAGLVMGVMIIPTIASLSEDAMTAVPQAMRQGSAALAANRMQTSLRVVLPAALSGIIAAIVLGISRAIGETMIVAIAAGSRAQLVTDPTMEGSTMTGFIARAALGDSRVGSLEYNTLFAVGLLLFVLTMLVNMVSVQIVRRFRQEY
ncbi:phosphate ABC transporter permease subunit PstC [Brachybacterium paraconglomeratum]|uniref:phosphate ABC transporter permease subunit PstC n=1 Tax=Brachybacterium paraconglomeratum TaxID=173362 RepID=UPI0022AF4A70|nr:phosphate ABC transporter permease subunit PstC [Brachybacterium paraconglomeratum]MCZ4328009.1 phosphate ABC transporter permease subunit PstC [Brachybacterium paraconglomeratum]